MTEILYYTKPGCMTSAKQVDLLRRSGHQVEIHDLITYPWQADELLTYFGDLPVAAWFNPNSPRVKSGEIDPAEYGREAALSLMLADHLLIRRPLMESGGQRLCGFDPAAVHAWVGLAEAVYAESSREDFTSCSQPPAGSRHCP
jgi:nitrogenase-associated protein